MTADPTLSALVEAARRAAPEDADTLFADLYAELHRLARRELSRHGSRSPLGVTTLLHEAYLDIAGRDSAAFADRGRFMGTPPGSCAA